MSAQLYHLALVGPQLRAEIEAAIGPQDEAIVRHAIRQALGSTREPARIRDLAKALLAIVDELEATARGVEGSIPPLEAPV